MGESLRLRQAAAILELSEGTVRKLVDSGRLSSWRTPGGNRRVALHEVVELRRELRSQAGVAADALQQVGA